jgi:hypothetical protein
VIGEISSFLTFYSLKVALVWLELNSIGIFSPYFRVKMLEIISLLFQLECF